MNSFLFKRLLNKNNILNNANLLHLKKQSTSTTSLNDKIAKLKQQIKEDQDNGEDITLSLGKAYKEINSDNYKKYVIVPVKSNMSTWRRTLFFKEMEQYYVKRSKIINEIMESTVFTNPLAFITVDTNFLRNFITSLAFPLVKYRYHSFKADKYFNLPYEDFTQNSGQALIKFFDSIAKIDRSIFKMIHPSIKKPLQEVYRDLNTMKTLGIHSKLKIKKIVDSAFFVFKTKDNSTSPDDITFLPIEIVAHYKILGTNYLSNQPPTEPRIYFVNVVWSKDDNGDWLIKKISSLYKKDEF